MRGGNFNPKKLKILQFLSKKVQFLSDFSQKSVYLDIFFQKSANLDTFPLMNVKNRQKLFHNFFAQWRKTSFFWQNIHLSSMMSTVMIFSYFDD